MLLGYNGNETLVNKDNTDPGPGLHSIPDLVPQPGRGTVNANVSGGTLEIYAVLPPTPGRSRPPAAARSRSTPRPSPTRADTISTDGSSNLVLDGATINGGNLTSASAAVIHGISDTTLNGVTITSGTTYSIDGGNNNYLTGDLINQGTVGRRPRQRGAASTPRPGQCGTINLSGGGTINLNNPNSFSWAINGNETLVNQDNLIQGQGTIDPLASFKNQATVNANVSGGTLWIYAVPTTNTGTLEATGGGTLHIYASTVTNTGGTISTDSTRTSFSTTQPSTAATSPPPAPP